MGDARGSLTIPPRSQSLAINDDAGACRKAAANDALSQLVAELSGELHAEAERVIVEATQKSDALLAERGEMIARLSAEEEAIRATLEHTDAALRTKSTECANALKQLEERTLAAAHLEERARGLERELATQRRCVGSLEQECERLQTAFERHQASEKGHQEQARRDCAQHAQELQKALNQASDALKAKAQELAALDRSNARYAQQSDDQDKRVHQLEQDRQRLLSEMKEHQAMVHARVKLQDRVEQATRDRERAEREVADARATMDKERTARQSAELALARSQARAQTLELVIAELRVNLTARGEL
ncbi:MAG: hypothetical protein ACREPF_08960 [Rhodanobacteraceae bacterium]